MAKRPELAALTGKHAGKRIQVPEAGIRVGRSTVNDLQFDHTEMSRSHCLFERAGEDGLTVLDLASANGTLVNGEDIGSAPRALAVGDVVEVGDTRIRIVGDEDEPAAPAAAASVDLGLGGGSAGPAAGRAKKSGEPERHPVLMGVLMAFAVACVAAAGYLLVRAPGAQPEDDEAERGARGVVHKGFVSLEYEKVEADAARIFRYSMTIDDGGTLRVVYDDVPAANRHVDKSVKLDEKARANVLRILDDGGWDGLREGDPAPGGSAGNALKSWRIRVVRDGRVKEILVENAREPAGFGAIREALEAFSRNELGIWAVQYSADQLRKLSEESERIGDAKWRERDVQHGNLYAAVAAYKEAVYHLETVDPKPKSYATLREKLDAAMEELDRRYKDQRFLADKAINLADWDAAKRELKILCEMVPGRDDPRNAEASAKLLDVEGRIGNGKKAKGGR